MIPPDKTYVIFHSFVSTEYWTNIFLRKKYQFGFRISRNNLFSLGWLSKLLNWIWKVFKKKKKENILLFKKSIKVKRMFGQYFFCSTSKSHLTRMWILQFCKIPNTSRWNKVLSLKLCPMSYQPPKQTNQLVMQNFLFQNCKSYISELLLNYALQLRTLMDRHFRL